MREQEAMHLIEKFIEVFADECKDSEVNITRQSSMLGSPEVTITAEVPLTRSYLNPGLKIILLPNGTNTIVLYNLGVSAGKKGRQPIFELFQNVAAMLIANLERAYQDLQANNLTSLKEYGDSIKRDSVATKLLDINFSEPLATRKSLIANALIDLDMHNHPKAYHILTEANPNAYYSLDYLRQAFIGIRLDNHPRTYYLLKEKGLDALRRYIEELS